MKWEKSSSGWELFNSGIAYIVAFILNRPDKYLLHIWDTKLNAFETPIELPTLEDAKNMGTMLVKIKYSEVLNGMGN
jgi:hypothetical protein